MFQGGELVSKTDCGGFDSLLPMPKNGELSAAACTLVLKTKGSLIRMGIDTLTLRHKGDLAQLVEQTAVNRMVTGSSPVSGATVVACW